MEQNLAGDGVIGGPDLAEVDQGIDSGEEGTVEPAPAL